MHLDRSLVNVVGLTCIANFAFYVKMELAGNTIATTLSCAMHIF